MMFLLDTDTCVFWLRGRAAVHARLAISAILVSAERSLPYEHNIHGHP